MVSQELLEWEKIVCIFSLDIYLILLKAYWFSFLTNGIKISDTK